MSTGVVRYCRFFFFAAVVLACARSHAINLVQGIDVSHWQGTIDWKKVAADPKAIKFVFMKATEDTNYFDDTFTTNLSGAKANGILAGPYHFCRLDTNTADPAADGAAEATYFLSKIKSKYQTNTYLPPVADIESFPSGVTKTFTSTWTDAFSDTIYNSLGVRPLIYTSQSKATSLFTSAVAGDCPLWNAAWHSSGYSSPPANSSVNPWGAWKFWQYSNDTTSYPSDGPISGVASGTRVDRDVFQGTLTQLQALLVGKDSTAKPGDFNRDGFVNSADYNVWLANNGKTVPIYSGADANGDAKVTSADLSVWVANVPEPSALILALFGLGVAMLVSRTSLWLTSARGQG